MLKKLATLAAGALFSLNASAGYLQYELTLSSSNTGWQNGFMVIDDTDKSIAFFDIPSGIGRFTPGERGDGWHFNRIYETTTSFVGPGPTNVYMRDGWRENQMSQIWLMFSDGDRPGTFNFRMRVLSEDWEVPYPYKFPNRDLTFTGTATASAFSMAPFFAADPGMILKGNVPYYDPTQVPEPGSITLVATGVAGLACLRRRRAKKSDCSELYPCTAKSND